MFIVHVGRDEEVLEAITRQATARGVTEAALTLIGAVQECTVSVMPKGNALEDVLTDYDTLGGDGVVVAGHLHRATVRDWFVRVYIQPVG